MGNGDKDERVDLPRVTEKQESVQKNENGELKPLRRKRIYRRLKLTPKQIDQQTGLSLEMKKRLKTIAIARRQLQITLEDVKTA